MTRRTGANERTLGTTLVSAMTCLVVAGMATLVPSPTVYGQRLPIAPRKPCFDPSVPPRIWDHWEQGNYVGPPRWEHLHKYRIRVDDRLEFLYRLTREESGKPYELNVGDVIMVESFSIPRLNRGDLSDGSGLVIQPDGTISLPLLGQVRAARLTVQQLQKTLEKRYENFYPVPEINVTPLRVNTKLEDLRAVVDRRAGLGGQVSTTRVTPEGTVQLPAIGSVFVQGLTLHEVKREIDLRYARVVDGIEVMPVLDNRAPTFVYVVGEVRNPGRHDMVGPTSVMHSISLAGGWNVGADLKNIIIFRRTEDWGLIATRVNVDAALYAKDATPADDIWLRDSDIIIIPKSNTLQLNEWIELVFTRGIYGVLPVQATVNFSKLSSI